MDDEDDWEAIQEELRRLTRRCQQESESREKAEMLLVEMKGAFEKLREDVVRHLPCDALPTSAA